MLFCSGLILIACWHWRWCFASAQRFGNCSKIVWWIFTVFLAVVMEQVDCLIFWCLWFIFCSLIIFKSSIHLQVLRIKFFVFAIGKYYSLLDFFRHIDKCFILYRGINICWLFIVSCLIMSSNLIIVHPLKLHDKMVKRAPRCLIIIWWILSKFAIKKLLSPRY